MRITLNGLSKTIEFDSNDLLFGYKLANKPKKNEHMILLFKKENNGMLPSALGIYIYHRPNELPQTGPLALAGTNSLLLSGKMLTENIAKVEKGKIVEGKCWNKQKIHIYDPESAEVQKFMGEAFGLRYTREMKLKQLNNIYENQ